MSKLRRRVVGTSAAVLAASLLAAVLALLLVAPRSGATTAVASTPSPPPTVTAGLLLKQAGALPPGSPVRSSALGLRVFVNAKDGFALANVGVGQQAIYPAASLDGGRSWHIDGPQLWVSAADATARTAEATLHDA